MVASLSGGIVPFFIGLTFLGGVEAWAAHPPFAGRRRWLARGVAVLWLLAAVMVGVGLVMYVAFEVVEVEAGPEATYLGLTATVYQLIGLYGGLALVLVSALDPGRWFWPSRS